MAEHENLKKFLADQLVILVLISYFDTPGLRNADFEASRSQIYTPQTGNSRADMHALEEVLRGSNSIEQQIKTMFAVMFKKTKTIKMSYNQYYTMTSLSTPL